MSSHLEAPSKEGSTIVDVSQDEKKIATDEGANEADVTVSEVKPTMPTFPEGGSRAWLVIFGVVCLNFSTFGIAVSWGAFQAYYEQALLKGYSSSTIAWIGSLQFSLIFMPGAITGRMLDLGYHKLPLGIASVVLVVCAFLVAECKEYWQFLLCQGIGMGLACGFIFPPLLGLISQWFFLRRATAFGITACGASLGGIIFPIMIRFLLPSVGFKWTARIIAFVMLFALILGFFTTRTRLPPRPVKHFINPELFRSPKQMFYCFASFSVFLGMYTILTYLVVSARAKGIDPNLAFYFVSIMNASSIVGRISGGLLGDRFGPLNMIIPFATGAGIVTFCWPSAHNVAGFVLISVFYGITFGAYVGLLPSPSAALGPMNSVGERVGMQLTIMSIAILIGSPVAGAVRAHPLGFKGAGIYGGCFIFLGVAFMILTKKAATGKWIKGKF